MRALQPRPMFEGAERLATAAELDTWTARALAGERLAYCEAPRLIPGPTADRARALEQEGLVRLCQERRAGGGFNYLLVRTSRKLRPAGDRTGSMDPALEAILRTLKRCANMDLPCPSDADLARRAGLATRDQAQWRIRKLVDQQLIRSTVAFEDGVPRRVVTIVATGKRTALPPKWAAAERSFAGDARAADQPGQPHRSAREGGN